jgi:PAS domain S-box-containing protein
MTEPRADDEAASGEKEAALRLQAALVDGAADAIVAVDQRLCITVWNRAAEALYGWRADEVIGRPIQEVIPAEFPNTTAQAVEQQLYEKSSWTGELAQRRQDGRAVRVLASISQLRDGAGALLGAVTVYHDITERARAEEALRESEERYRALFDRSLDGVYVFDFTGAFLDANAAALNMLGYTHAEIRALSLADILAKDQLPLALDALAELRQSDTRPDWPAFRMRRKDGAYVWAEIQISVIYRQGKPFAVQGVARDITARRRAEEAIARRLTMEMAVARTTEVFVSGSDDLTPVLGALGEALSVQRAFTLRIGADGEHFDSLHLWYAPGYAPPDAHFPSDPVALFLWERSRVGQDVIISDISALPEEASVERASLEALDAHALLLTPVPDPRGQPVGFAGFAAVGQPRQWADDEIYSVHVIVERLGAYWESLAARERLRQSEERYRTLVEQLPGVTYSARLDELGSLLYISPQIEKLAGYTPQECLADPAIWQRLTHPGGQGQRRESYLRSLTTGEPFADEYRLLARDGRTVWVRDEGAVIREAADGPLVVRGMMSDITEHKELEARFQQGQKMEAVGRLASGVAHDFNNQLTVILGFASFFLQSFEIDDPRAVHVRQILMAAERSAGLTRQLLAFSRKQTLQPVLLNLNQEIGATEKLLRRLIGENIKLVFAPGAEVTQVTVDPTQLSQVIMNLAVNARDAMPDGGALTIETHNVTLDESYTRHHPDLQPGRYVMLAISDTGSGMSEEVKAHLFEPFFTTKAAGQGTGLGLSTVYGITKQSGGHISVYSELGRGTTIRVYLPRADAESVAEAAAKAAPARSLQGDETVLVVEDEEQVRQMVCLVLRSQGYRVIEADSGEHAREAAAAFSERIHLLLTDVVLTGMSGRVAAKSLAADRPEMKVLYMSGYTDDAIERHGVLEAHAAHIAKPFTPFVLASKVRDVLDR